MRLSVQRMPVRDSRSTPNRHVSYGKHGESDPDLHSENLSFSQVVGDWFPRLLYPTGLDWNIAFSRTAEG
jgi:hypothetical protein